MKKSIHKLFYADNCKKQRRHFVLSKLLSALLLVIIVASNADAGGTFNTRQSGNWSDPRTWSTNGNQIPGPGDKVNISGRTDLYIDIPLAECGELSLQNASGSASLNFGSISTSGVFTAASNKLVVAPFGSGGGAASGAVTVTVPTTGVNEYKILGVWNGTLECQSLTLTGATATRRGIVDIIGGLLHVHGDINFAGTTNATINVTGYGIVRVGGAFGKTGTFNSGAYSTVIFDGTAPQELPTVYNYANIYAENPAGVTLDGAIPQGKVTGEVRVQKTGLLKNGGHSIVGMPGSSIRVFDGATLELSGTSGFPSGFGTTWLGVTSKVHYNGTDQVVKSLYYGKLALSKSASPAVKTLEASTSVRTNLEINQTNFVINNNTLTIESAGNITNASAAGYIVNGNSGKVVIQKIGTGPGGRTGEMIFPVGTSLSYTPAYLTNFGPAADFSVRVENGVRDEDGYPITEGVVNRTWDVNNETTNGNPDVKLRLQFSSSDVTPNFNWTQSAIHHFSTQYGWTMIGTPGPMEGTNPYIAQGVGITSFSPFTVGNGVVLLPVELVYFNAYKTEEGAYLKWQTASEKDNKGFEVQVSPDGRNFESIGFVASENGNSTAAQQYEYNDKQAGKNGLWYYRLKQIDLDGTTTYSQSKAVDFGKLANEVNVYPNPFQEQFTFKILSAEVGDLAIQIRDITGKTILESTQQLVKGNNNIPVELANQPKGIYLLTAKNGSQTYQARIIKE